MSTQEAVCVRFPNGSIEFTFTSATPEVGDKVRRGDDEWEVVAIGMDSNENRVVTLGAPGRSEGGLASVAGRVGD